MAMPQRNTYRKKAPRGFRWKTVTKVNAMGRPYTTHILVPIESAKVPPETIFTAEESIRGAEDRKDSMPDIVPGGKRRLKEATIPLGYGQDEGEIDDGLGLLDTKVLLDQTQAKRRVPPPPQYPSQASGALPPRRKEEPFRPPSWASTLTDPNQLPAEAAGRNRPRDSFSSLQMVPGSTPANPYKGNVGPIYGGEMRNVDPNSLEGRQKDVDVLGVLGRGPHVGWGADGQAIYMEDVLSIGPGGGVGKTAETTVKILPRMVNAVKAFFKKKGGARSEYDEAAAAARTERARKVHADKTPPIVGEASKVVDDAPKVIKGPGRARRALSAITPGKKTTVVAGEAGLLGTASYPLWKDNAIINDVIDSVVETTHIAKAKVIEEAKSAWDVVEQAGETVQGRKDRLAREAVAKSTRAKGLLTIPDKDARAGAEFFGAGDVAGDSLTPEKAKTPVAAVEDPLKKFWGKYADDPAKRKQKYLDSLSSIWRKAAIMDAIAAATGGESRAPQFMTMMSQRMDAIAKFDDEERLHNIFKAVYYNPETGVYNAPKDKTDAYERAIKLGASPAEAKKIFGYQPEPDNQLVEWYYKDPVTGEYVTEHVRGKDTMPEGDYNWSKGKTPILRETEEIGGTQNERAWNEIKATLGRGGLEGNLDDAIRIYMKYDKVDPITGFDPNQARSNAEKHIMATMTSQERKPYTYTPTEGEELTEERLEELRRLGYAFVIVDGKEQALIWKA